MNSREFHQLIHRLPPFFLCVNVHLVQVVQFIFKFDSQLHLLLMGVHVFRQLLFNLQLLLPFIGHFLLKHLNPVFKRVDSVLRSFFLLFNLLY